MQFVTALVDVLIYLKVAGQSLNVILCHIDWCIEIP